MKQRKGKSIAWYLLRITYTSYYSWKKVRGSRAPHWWPQSILLFLMPFPSCYYEFSEPPRTLVPRNGYHAGRHREINRTAQKNRRKEISFSRGQFFRSIDIRTVLSLFQGHHVVKEKGSLGNRSFLSEKFSTTTTTTTTTKHFDCEIHEITSCWGELANIVFYSVMFLCCTFATVLSTKL